VKSKEILFDIPNFFLYSIRDHFEPHYDSVLTTRPPNKPPDKKRVPIFFPWKINMKIMIKGKEGYEKDTKVLE
jgi:hypothetical protein